MTTVISNGHYLIADHRRGTTETSKFRNHQVAHTNIRTGELNLRREKEIYISRDIAEKIFLLPQTLSSDKHGNIIAIATYGLSQGAENFLDRVLWFIKSKSFPEKSLNILLDIPMFNDVKLPLGVVMVTDTSHTVALDLKLVSNKMTFKINVLKPGVMFIGGSGGAKIKSLSLPVQKFTPEELFLVAQYLDPHTSPSYGVLGVSEKKYYPFVLEPIKTLRERSKKIIIDNLSHNHNNTYKSLLSVDADEYTIYN